MAIKLILSSEQISEKIFKGVPRGYDPYEVDKFLDRIMKDYETVESNYLLTKQEVEDMKRRIKELESEKTKVEIELNRIKTKYKGVKSTDNVTEENIELLQKINKYERFLWQNGFNPYNIK